MEEHVLVTLARRYPQLVIPIEEGASSTPLYADLVRRGASIGERTPDFTLDGRDWLRMLDTPAGSAEALMLYQRCDFEHAVRALAYRCEPKDIPASMGALALSGLVDWGKIADHKAAWLAEGHTILEWPDEFSAFTKERENIRGSIIILSSGPYSAVSADEAGEAEDDWIAHSITIRTYHELTHFVSRRLFPENEHAIRDEAIADYVGLVAAYGTYNARLARLFFGIEGEGVKEGGRLRNYVSEGESLEDVCALAHALVDRLGKFDGAFSAKEDANRHFEALLEIESHNVARDLVS